MSDSDPLTELAPFLKARRDLESSEDPPEYLTARLIASRRSGQGPASAPVPEDELPRRFGSYLLSKVLGRGATGTVYQAYHEELDRQVAIKILAPELAGLVESQERFLREARAAAGMQHDHLMPVFAVHRDTPFPCLTMPLLTGETLQQKLDREGPLPTKTLIKLARQITSGLQYAHEKDILHRDLKPSNIFYESTTKRAIVMDFGLARSLQQPSDLTLDGTIAGTPEFLAPEQIDDNPRLGPATDLYGLGATLYTLASGRPPFSGHSLTGLLKKVATAPPAPLRDHPAWLNQLILSLLEKSPSQRPHSAKEVMRLLCQQSGSIKKPVVSRFIIPGAFAALFLIGILIWTKVGKNDGSPSNPFLLQSALTSGASEIEIPDAGVFDFEPINLDYDLKITAAKPGTVLRFTSTGIPIRTNGSLVFENLTLRDDLALDAETRNLVHTSGPSLTFENCRIEQAGKQATSLPEAPLISAEHSLNLNLKNSSIIAFRTPFFRGKNGSKVTMKNTFAMAPALLIAADEGGQELELNKVTVICMTLAVVSPEQEPVIIAAKNCHLEVNNNFLWAPYMESESLKNELRWSGDGNTFATMRGWLSTSPNRRRNRQRSQSDLVDFDSWQKFWQSDSNSSEVAPVILPLNLPRELAHPMEVKLEEILNLIPN